MSGENFDKKPWILVFVGCIVGLLAVIGSINAYNYSQKALQYAKGSVQIAAFAQGYCVIEGSFEGYVVDTPNPTMGLDNKILYEPGTFSGVFNNKRWEFSLQAGEVAQMFSEGNKVFVKIKHYDPDSENQIEETKELFDISS